MSNYMNKCYLITVVKVVAIVVVVVFAIPYLFGFAAGFFNSIVAGYLAGVLVACVGIYAICRVIANTLRRDCVSTENSDVAMPERKEG